VSLFNCRFNNINEVFQKILHLKTTTEQSSRSATQNEAPISEIIAVKAFDIHWRLFRRRFDRN